MATTTIKNMNMPFTSYYVPTSSYSSFITEELPGTTVRVWKYGKLVIIQLIGFLRVKTTQGSNWGTLFTLPSEYRPSELYRTGIFDDATYSQGHAQCVEVRVTTTGEFQVYSPIQGMKLWGTSIAYFTN